MAKQTVSVRELAPQEGPQMQFARCGADECLYGGAAGGGKSWSLLAEAARYVHVSGYHALLMRRLTPELTNAGGLVDLSHEMFQGWGQFVQTRLRWTFPSGATINFGHCERDVDRHRYQSAQFAYIGIDQCETFSERVIVYMLSRLRTMAGVPTRFRLAANPPDDEQAGADWLLERYMPWLDGSYPNPALPAEVRWFARRKGKDVEVLVGSRGAMSRTYVPALLQDNKILMEADPSYMARLQSLPEPYRSMLLEGNWLAGRSDERRVIPIDWVRAAQARWVPEGGLDKALTAVGVDVGRGGNATVLARRFEDWYAPLDRQSTPDTMVIPGHIQKLSDDGAVKVIDVIGVGAGVVDRLKELKVPKVVPFNGAAKSGRLDQGGHYGFVNLRAEAWWNAREMLDPANEHNVALPPDSELLTDLTSARWAMQSNGIKLEPKEKIANRIGRSPDAGDAVVMAMWAGSRVPAAAIMGEPIEHAAQHRERVRVSQWWGG